MVEIVSIGSDNSINFRFSPGISSCLLNVKTSNFENPVFSQLYMDITPGTIFFVGISHELIPHLRGTYLQAIYGDKSFEVPFEFKQHDLRGYSIISNSCLGWRIYERFNSPYNSPLIGSLILDDEKYIRLCEHTESYLDSDIKFGDVRENARFYEVTGRNRAINGNLGEEKYPVSHHLDIDIHWIHSRRRNLEILDNCSYSFSEDKQNDEIPLKEFEERWIRRVERSKGTKRICVWSTSEMYNSHGNWRRKELIRRFKNLDKPSILLTERRDEAYEDDMHVVRFIPQWEGRNTDERNPYGVMLWGDQMETSEIIKDIITNKFL